MVVTIDYKVTINGKYCAMGPRKVFNWKEEIDNLRLKHSWLVNDVSLYQLMAPLLDMVYGSDEKDKVVPLLTSIMHNVTPYLKNHR